MLIKSIRFVTPLTDIEDIYDDNIDMILEVNFQQYTVTLGTQKIFGR